MKALSFRIPEVRSVQYYHVLFILTVCLYVDARIAAVLIFLLWWLKRHPFGPSKRRFMQGARGPWPKETDKW